MQAQPVKYLPNDIFHFDQSAHRETNYSWVAISETKFLFSWNLPFFVPLQVIWVQDSDSVASLLALEPNQNLKKRSLFIVPEIASKLIAPLLQAEAFDVMMAPLRIEEFRGKLEYYFSNSHQAMLFKRSLPLQLELTAKEQGLFDYLLVHPQGVVRSEMMNKCWAGYSVHPKTLDVHLFNLRKKLENIGAYITFQNGLWALDLSKINS